MSKSFDERFTQAEQARSERERLDAEAARTRSQLEQDVYELALARALENRQAFIDLMNAKGVVPAFLFTTEKVPARFIVGPSEEMVKVVPTGQRGWSFVDVMTQPPMYEYAAQFAQTMILTDGSVVLARGMVCPETWPAMRWATNRFNMKERVPTRPQDADGPHKALRVFSEPSTESRDEARRRLGIDIDPTSSFAIGQEQQWRRLDTLGDNEDMVFALAAELARNKWPISKAHTKLWTR